MKKTQKPYWRMMSLFIAVMLVALAMVGCAPDNKPEPGQTEQPEGSNTTEGTSQETERPKVQLVTDNFQPVNPDPEGAMHKKLEEITGYDVDITWFPLSDYPAKVNTLIAGGDLPEILMIGQVKGPGTVKAVRDGIFWELTDHLDKYPSLSKISQYQRESISIDGKDWAVPRDMDMAFNAPVYRSDWLRNLGMEPPTTIDELKEMFLAFTHNDPDGNGIDDTYGQVENRDFKNYIMTVIYYGGPNEWEIADNKVVPMWEHEAWWKALDYYRDLYEEGAINSNFLTMSGQESKEQIEIGKAGGSIAHVWQITERWGNFKTNFPDGDLDVAYIVDVNGESRHYPSNGGVSGMYVMSKSAVADEAALDRCLTFLDRLAHPDYQNLIQYGIEGVHFELVDGKARMIDEQAYGDEVNVWRRIKPHTMLDVYSPSEYDSGAARRDAFIKSQANNTVPNPVMKYVSPTYVERGADLDTMMQDGVVKYVMGEIDMNGLKDVVENWYAQGGTKICEEYTELWQADN